MKTQCHPYIEISRGMSSPDTTSTLSDSTRQSYQAIWGSKILLRPFEELVKVQWGWSARDLANEMMERQHNLLETLYGICFQTFGGARFSLRFVQQADKSPLSIFLFAKISACSEDEVENKARKLWNQIQSVFPYDYALEPLISAEKLKPCMTIPAQSNGTDYGAVIYPLVQTLRSRQHEKQRATRILGTWGGANTNPENIWRVLHHTQALTILDILLQPTIVKKHEIDYLITSTEALTNATKTDMLIGQLMKERASTMSQRVLALHKAFMIQVRLISSGDVSTTARVISSALTNKGQPHQLHTNIFSLNDHNAPWLTKKFIEMDFIPFRRGIHPALQRIPFIATIPEAQTIFRLPILPKGGIPGLNMEYQSNKVAQDV